MASEHDDTDDDHPTIIPSNPAYTLNNSDNPQTSSVSKDSDTSITTYYTQFKSLFDELDELQSISDCNCGASKSLTKRDDERINTTATLAFHSSKHDKSKWCEYPKLKCDHCSKNGHVKDKCLKIVGYPEHWETRRPLRRDHNKHGCSRCSASLDKRDITEGLTLGHTLHGTHTRTPVPPLDIMYMQTIHEYLIVVNPII
ncbi:unnamed protein product [Vicia faba]|uniref:CCHC-type domain-containing protein n=1 Tax=Vicia faba TaxID=3906 RepID=A0AAV1AQA0_VICFA|nr:unnamed protein product [Vicia faba]